MIYIVGIGVGDCDILTLKAKNILKKRQFFYAF